ncbi:MAG: hypothetical protein RBS75_04965 [Methylophilaceae bacterium]|jgi:outer membrane biogenesis lipoprotein LolB|nr:hypothetical protein [Methylophilaceae bacterium]
MKFFSQSLIALFIAGLLLTGCGKKEEPAINEPTAVEQSLQEAEQATDQAMQYSTEAAEEAKAAGN